MEKYFIEHTPVSLLQNEKWKEVPYLKDNNGDLPPFVIAVGDARRVEKACEILNLQNVVKLHEEGRKLLGLKGQGRVDVIIGEFEHEGKLLPITIFETQMGMPATEINLREVLSHVNPKYKASENINMNAAYVIRVGTAASINTRENPTEVPLGSIVNGTFAIGWVGTLIEALGGLDYSSKETIQNFKKEWMNRGFRATDDGVFPAADSSKEIVEAIDSAAKDLDVKCFKGGNFSKDSLYCETNEDLFITLREKYKIVSTEMEQMAIAKVATDMKEWDLDVKFGLVSGIIGIVPGVSSAGMVKGNPKVEIDSLTTAALALWKIAYEA